MKRFVIFVAAAAAFISAGYWIYYFGFQLDYYRQLSDLWVIITPTIILFGVGVGLLIWATSFNIHRLKTGTVVNHSFTPANSSFIFIPVGNGATMLLPTPAGDEWAIQIQDNRGRTGWLCFSENVLVHYPIGSSYPS